MKQARLFQLSTAQISVLFLMVLFFFALSEPAFAGPGGEVVELVFKTKIGRIVGLILAIIFLPLIVWVLWKEKRAAVQTMKDLEALAADFPWYSWQLIEDQTREAAHTLYQVWETGDISAARPFLTDDYGESQQAILDRWNAEGKTNITQASNFGKFSPLYLTTPDWNQYSTVFVRFSVDLVDYMVDNESGKKIKGSKGKQNVEMIFAMVYEDSRWLLHSIEQGSESLNIASEANQLDRSFLEQHGSTPDLQIPGAYLAQPSPAEEAKEGMINISPEAEGEREPSQNNYRTPD